MCFLAQQYLYISHYYVLFKMMKNLNFPIDEKLDERLERVRKVKGMFKKDIVYQCLLLGLDSFEKQEQVVKR